jgi:hypothetical protein
MPEYFWPPEEQGMIGDPVKFAEILETLVALEAAADVGTKTVMGVKLAVLMAKDAAEFVAMAQAAQTVEELAGVINAVEKHHEAIRFMLERRGIDTTRLKQNAEGEDA